jgi:peptidyl-tRNA hydrolase
MPAGKACSQAAHAALMSFLAADDARRRDYHADGIGTKICLEVTDLPAILKFTRRADERGLPHFLVEDTGNNTTFGGIPTISALGIGPLYPHETEFLSRLPLYP